ncbi:MAG: hypothetical protein AAB373_05890 [Patescibacteria group bacterium]
MSHNRYIAIIASSGLISWLGWLLVVYKLSVYRGMGLALGFFYLTLFIALSATFAVIGYYFRVWLYKNEIFYKHINVALRQGIFLSLIANFCLVLQMMKVLNWWSGILLVMTAVLLEFYFSSKDSEYDM